MEIVYEKMLKSSEDLAVGDEFRVAGLYMRVDEVKVNTHDDMILRCTIIGQGVKKRSKVTIIIPKKLPIETLS